MKRICLSSYMTVVLGLNLDVFNAMSTTPRASSNTQIHRRITPAAPSTPHISYDRISEDTYLTYQLVMAGSM